MKRFATLIVALGLLGAYTGCLNDIEQVPLAPALGDIPIPRGLAARVDDGVVSLSWREEAAARYRVYRGAGEAAAPERIAETVDTIYVDTDVRNGQEYAYSVSAVNGDGIEGRRCEPVAASPTAYSVVINSGASYTGSSSVVLQLTAPVTTVLMMIADSPAFPGSVWETYRSAAEWRLPEGDGMKTVYVRFQDGNGSQSPVKSDEIYLDTYAKIVDVACSPFPYRYSPGATVGFTLSVEGDETGGEAWIEMENFTDRVYLTDDGRGGDAVAADGVYGTEFTFPLAVRGVEFAVAGFFSDRAGNQALPFESSIRISFTDPPGPVVLVGVQDSTVNSITIRWIPSEEEHFTRYEIYRDVQPNVTDDPVLLIQELYNISQSAYPNGGLVEGETYYYRVYVVNDLEESAGSNQLVAHTYDAYPTPVTLDDPSSIGTDRLTLTWSANADTDFEEYRLYRSTSPGVTDQSQLVTTIHDRAITYYDDSGLNLGSNTYYYRVFVYDKGGKQSRSNEVTTAS